MVRDLYFSLPSLPSFIVTNGSLLPVDSEAEKLFLGDRIFLHFSTLPITLPSYKMLHHIVYSRWSPLVFITTYSCFLLTSCSGGILNYSLCLQSRVITSSHFVRPYNVLFTGHSIQQEAKLWKSTKQLSWRYPLSIATR